MCAYLSALPFSLSISFYPLLLAQQGYGEESSGVLVALRAVGSIAASLVASRFVRSGPQTLWPVYCGIAVAIAVALVPTVNHPVPIALWMLVVGAGSAAMTLYFQITISEASRVEQRGSALALGGLGWSVSHFTTPLIMGFLADRYGLVTGFYVIGALDAARRDGRVLSQYHAPFVWLAVLPARALGDAGQAVWPAFGAGLAVWWTGRWAFGLLGPAAGVIAAGLALFASPLLFYASVFWEHTLTASTRSPRRGT